MASTTANRVRNLVLAWMAVSAVIMTTACNKNGGGKAGSGGGAPAPAASPAPAKGPGELDGGSSRSTIDRAHGGNSSNVGNVNAGNDQTSSTNTQSTSTARPSESVIHYDPSGMTPDQIFQNSASLPPTVIGAQTNISNEDLAPLYYSGSGQDTLHEEIRELVESETNSAIREANREFAREVTLGQFRIDWNTRVASVSLIIKKNGRRELVKTEGRLDHNLVIRAGNLKAAPHIAIDAACMDRNGGCQTVHMKVQHASGKKMVRTAHIIVRETPAALVFEGRPMGRAGNANYDQFLDVLLNSAAYPGTIPTVKKLTLTTSETINGQSSFTVSMRMRHRSGEELLAWNGALVKPSDSDRLNIRVQKVPQTTVIDGRDVQLDGYIANTITETNLVRNDGRGSIQLDVAVAGTGSQLPEPVRLTIARIHKPVRRLILR